jgi:predicted Zn-dependent protease
MCWRCIPNGNNNEDIRAIDAAIEAAAQDRLRRWRLSRRTLLRTGLGLLAWPAAESLQACATVPVTGRSQLRLISEQEEAQIGIQAFQQLRQQEVQKGRLLTEREDPAAHAWVKRVSDRVIWASGLGNKYRWEYMIINAPKTVNAAAIAGGRIIVYSGILPVAQSDAGLATIIGHEVGHVMAHHTAERISQYQLVNIAGAVAGAAGLSDLTMAAVGLGVQVGVEVGV